jgi:DNA-binding transcriptional regulator/RsmH inhibitor MraZ
MLTEDLVEVPVADLVNDALKQAFVAGGASLVDQSERLTLEGEITEVAVSEKDGGFEVTIRTHVTLKRGSQSAFNTVIFGRASGQSLDQAVRATLDKLVNSLILDDYFLMEVL